MTGAACGAFGLIASCTLSFENTVASAYFHQEVNAVQHLLSPTRWSKGFRAELKFAQPDLISTIDGIVTYGFADSLYSKSKRHTSR